MRKIVSVVALMLFVFAFSISVASAQMYISGNLGAVVVNDSDLQDEFGNSGELTYDTGFGLLAALGHSYGTGMRTEVELGYRFNDMDDLNTSGLNFDANGDVTSLSLMANAFYDFYVNGPITPFIGGGIGVANIEADADNSGSEDDTVFGYQLAAGGSFDMTESVKFDLQYRFFGTSDPEFDGLEAEYYSHNFFAGIRYMF